MGIDELKVIIQALAGLADGAKEGFIWWMVIEGALPKLLLAAFGAGMLGTGIYVAKLAERHASSSENSQAALRQIARLTGKVMSASCVSKSDAECVVDAVERLTREKGASK